MAGCRNQIRRLRCVLEHDCLVLQLLKNAGIEAGGLTMCWSYPKEKNQVLGEAVLRAAEQVCGLKYVMMFNEPGDEPAVVYRRDDGAMAVLIRPNVGDVYDHTFGKKTEEDIRRDADWVHHGGRSERAVCRADQEGQGAWRSTRTSRRSTATAQRAGSESFRWQLIACNSITATASSG